MRLEKFSKNEKQKKIIISAIVGLILLVGGITLYRTFALYEEKKEFNVLRGKVPDFTNNGDIKFAVLINGTSETNIPKKNTGYVYTGYECSDKEVSIRWSNNDWAPTVLNLNTKGTNCTLKFDYVPNNLYEKVSTGDYISYIPEKTSYKISTDLTGYSKEQEIYPSELNLWRVIRKNDSDGTVEIVSEYVSSTNVYFYSKNGVEKYIESLNRIANQYETEGITTKSRHMGYNGQSELVTISGATVAPWTTTLGAPKSENEITVASPNGSEREKAGGGDYGYITDYNLVKNAIGTANASKVGTTTATSYWLASRHFHYNSDGSFCYDIRTSNNGEIKYAYPICYNNGWGPYNFDGAIRPILTLSPTLQVTEGTMSDKKIWTIN